MNFVAPDLRPRLHHDVPVDAARICPIAECSHGRVVAVVVTHNRLKKLRQTVSRLLACPQRHIDRIVIVDNASSDGTSAFLQSIHDARLTVLSMECNLGGAGGFHVGLQQAVARFDPDWLVVMDDDARPAPDAIARFHQSDVSNWDAIAAATYHADGQICDINRPTRDPFRSWTTFFKTLGKGREGFHLDRSAYASAKPAPIDGASFVGLFLSRRGAQLMGLPQADLFIYADDALQTLKMSRNGGRLAFFPTIMFEHDTDTVSANQEQRPFWKVYYQHRNGLILYREAAGWMFWPVVCLVLPRWMMRVRAYRGKRLRFLSLMLRAVAHGLRGQTQVPHQQVLAWAADRPARSDQRQI